MKIIESPRVSREMIHILVGGDWNMAFIISIYWKCHHPNWRTPSFFGGVAKNHQHWISMNIIPLEWSAKGFGSFPRKFIREYSSEQVWPTSNLGHAPAPGESTEKSSELLQKLLPKLCNHLDENGILVEQFLHSWHISLFAPWTMIFTTGFVNIGDGLSHYEMPQSFISKNCLS